MTMFFTSDQHFGHENIIKHCARPFANADEMDSHMIERWNSVVGPADTVYHLGDFAHKRTSPERVAEIVGHLNGSIELVVGNHELDETEWFDSKASFTNRMCIDTGLFASVNPGYREILMSPMQLVVMSHYALETWHGSSKGKSYHLHGHSHGKLKKKTRRLDVGVDTHSFRPWSWEEIKQNFGKVDAF